MPTTRTIDHGILEEKSEHKRPDRAETLKRVHEAAEHDAWFREQVQLALDEADQPDAVFIPHEVVMAELKAQLDSIATCAGIVAYRIKREAVHILRILHGAQNWPRKL